MCFSYINLHVFICVQKIKLDNQKSEIIPNDTGEVIFVD